MAIICFLSSVWSSVFEIQYVAFGVCQADQPEPVAGEEELELAAADLPRLGRAVEDRRVLPGRALDAVVLAEGVRAPHHHAERAVALPVRAHQLVHARRLRELRASSGAASGSRPAATRRRPPGPPGAPDPCRSRTRRTRLSDSALRRCLRFGFRAGRSPGARPRGPADSFTSRNRWTSFFTWAFDASTKLGPDLALEVDLLDRLRRRRTAPASAAAAPPTCSGARRRWRCCGRRS